MNAPSRFESPPEHQLNKAAYSGIFYWSNGVGREPRGLTERVKRTEMGNAEHWDAVLNPLSGFINPPLSTRDVDYLRVKKLISGSGLYGSSSSDESSKPGNLKRIPVDRLPSISVANAGSATSWS